MTLLKNTSSRNFGDGIDITTGPGSKLVLDGNKVFNNRNGTGIENNGGTDTTLKDNTMRGNRTDLAGRGSSTTGSGGGESDCELDPAVDGGGNVFTTGGFKVCTPFTGDEREP